MRRLRRRRDTSLRLGLKTPCRTHLVGALTDDDVLAHLGHFGIEKISEEVPSAPSRDPDSVPAIDPNERLVVWANDA